MQLKDAKSDTSYLYKCFHMLSESDISRFWSKVEKTGTCWLWTAGLNEYGYGKFWTNGKTIGAHRISLQISLGREISPEMVVAHLPLICHNPACVNPEHLRETTQADNISDQRIDGTLVAGERQHLSKLIGNDIRNIRIDPRSITKIAIEYGVSKQNISMIKAFKTWKHII